MNRVDPILALLLSPFIASMCLLLGLAVIYVARLDRARKIRRARERGNQPATLEHIEHVRQVVAAATAKARMAESPANERTPAPWFTGGDAA